MFCLSEFINNCKSNFNIIPKSKLAIYRIQISSPDSPDSGKPFLSNSRMRRPLLKCRKATVAKLKQETCPELSDNFLAWNRWLLRLSTTFPNRPPHDTSQYFRQIDEKQNDTFFVVLVWWHIVSSQKDYQQP